MSTVKVKSTTVDFDPLRNPDMFKFGGNPEKKKVVKKAVVAKKEVKATPKKGAGEAKKKPPAPKPQPEPEPEEEEEEEDIFGAAANEGEGSIPKSFLDGAPVATSSSDKDPFAEGKADEQETGGLQDVYIPKEAMEKRNNELKAEALDEDLVNMGDDADLAKFDSQNEDGKKLVLDSHQILFNNNVSLNGCLVVTIIKQ